MEHTICTIIVTYNNESDIKTCLDSIQNQTFSENKIIVVDNNSSDNTKNIVKEYKNVDFIQNNKNLFLTGANNKGIRYAIKKYNPEFVFVLNPDTKLNKNLIEILYKKINNDSQIGAIGPKIKFFNNKNEGLINSAGLIYDGFMQAYDRGFEENDNGQYDSDEFVFGVSGAGILYRVKMLNEIGLYWEKIKLYMDELELFIRANKKGWKVLYSGEATLWHSYMKSTSQKRLEFINKEKAKTWLWIALKHYNLKSKIAMLVKYIFKLS